MYTEKTEVCRQQEIQVLILCLLSAFVIFTGCGEESDVKKETDAEKETEYSNSVKAYKHDIEAIEVMYECQWDATTEESRRNYRREIQNVDVSTKEGHAFKENFLNSTDAVIQFYVLLSEGLSTGDSKVQKVLEESKQYSEQFPVLLEAFAKAAETAGLENSELEEFKKKYYIAN